MYIKKLAMQGFKSFVKKTEVPFTPGINVILGPNGSGKSNVSDALCFVLGRLSIKSMRAAKAQNLIFLGSKSASPAKEASVEIIFDNSDQTFAIDKKEISLKRIVRRNGQSIYKINGETKTRQDVLTLLAQAGIDPNGFNIILQGEIQNFVRMHNEERRKVIEEVSGISIYETRKEKSLKELDKTEEKLKEVTAVLRERTAHLNNLEKERQQALKYKKLESDVKKLKASIIYGDLTKKKKENQSVEKEIESKNKEIEKQKKSLENIETEIKNTEDEIDTINSTIKKSTGVEQEKLNQEIANLRADLAGLRVKIESHERKLSELEKQKENLKETIKNNEEEINRLQKESPTVAKKQKEIDSKKKELEQLEEQRKKFYMARSELKSIKERIYDKRKTYDNYQNESDILLKQINNISLEIFDIKSSDKKVNELKSSLNEKKRHLSDLEKKESELDKMSHTNEFEIDKQRGLIEKISKMDTCPLCKSRITKEHINEIHSDVEPEIQRLEKEISSADKELNEIYSKKEVLKKDIEQLSSEISQRESDIIKISNIENKKEQIKSLQSKLEQTKSEISELEKRKNYLESKFDENSNIEEKYENKKIELNDISSRTEENVNSEISFKQRELEKSKASLKQIIMDEETVKEDLRTAKKDLSDKEKTLQNKKKQEEELTKKFEKMISKRDSLHVKLREKEKSLSEKKNSIHQVESKVNDLRIEKAKFEAEIENLEVEMLEFPDTEIIKGSKESLSERLRKTKETIDRIGSVNLRSLEVYDSVKDEYEKVREKTETISKEKEGILKIIHEIDVKKKKTLLKTLSDLNEKFSRNFSQISAKGQVSLELENKKDPFSGGIGIQVKTGHGKYFDVTSLSGGEQTMVALSLIFAIQELKPYPFYILDEIDAALDKRNSERLASLLNKYTQKGQYIIVSHNDEIITNATNLFGVSMHDGISKLTSLKL